MYAFFTVFGTLFIVISSILIDYIYNIFSINKITSFLYPVDHRTVLNEINITILPIIIWSVVELPVLGDNINFIMAIVLNTIVSCAIMYEVKYGLVLLTSKEKKTIDIIAIVIATIIGQLVFFMVLKSKPIVNISNYHYIISILGIIIILAVHTLLTLKNPLFRIKKETKYEEKR